MLNIKSIECDDKAILKDVISRMHGRSQKKCQQCQNDQGSSLCDSCDNIDRKRIMENAYDSIVERYEFFEENVQDLEAVLQSKCDMDASVKKILIDTYNQSDLVKRLKAEIKNSLPNALKAKCPYCMISEPNTMEHYFDKDEFPEYTLFSKNLIPCCSQCNSLKGTRLIVNGARSTLNFYYDILPTSQFSSFKMHLDDKMVPTFDVVLALDVSKAVDKVIQNHFDVLHLRNRYSMQIPDLLSNLLDEAKERMAEGISLDDVIKVFRIRISTLRKNNGTNYWEACFYESVIENLDDFQKLVC